MAQERSTDVAELEVLRQREMAEKRARALQRGNRWVAGCDLTLCDHGPRLGNILKLTVTELLMIEKA